MPSLLASRMSLAAHSRTCPTPPGAPESSGESSVWIESTTTALGRSWRIVASITSTSVSERTLKPLPSTPSRRALRATCRGDSSPETIRQPSPTCPMTWSKSVLFPTPGSPPTRTMEPGTIPPPRTLFNSPTPASILPPPSTTGTSLRASVLPATRAFCLVARSAKPTTFLLSRTSSTKVLHSPQSGQRPSHLGSECPQLEQVYSVFVATPRLYWIAAKVQQTRGQYRLDGQRVILSYILWTREVWMMQTRRTLRKVGGSVMLPIPPEMLEELRLGAGQDVEVSSGGNMIRVEQSAPRPSPDAVEFMARFTRKYDEAMRNLARR